MTQEHDNNLDKSSGSPFIRPILGESSLDHNNGWLGNGYDDGLITVQNGSPSSLPLGITTVNLSNDVGFGQAIAGENPFVISPFDRVQQRGSISTLSDYDNQKAITKLGGQLEETKKDVSGYKRELKQLNDTIKDLTTGYSHQYNESEKKLQDLSEFAAGLEESSKKLKSDLDTLKQEKVNLIGILGIFVSIFTFVSVEINILKTATSFLQIAGLSAIMFSGLILFICLLHLISMRWVNGKYDNPPILFMAFVGLIWVIGVLLTAAGDNEAKTQVQPANTIKEDIVIETETENIEKNEGTPLEPTDQEDEASANNETNQDL